MYKCNCGREFLTMRSLRSHARFCDEYEKIGDSSPSKYKMDNNLYRCECGREFDNYQSLNGHFSHCLIHRNGIPGNKHIKKGKMAGWDNFSEEKKRMISKKAGNSFKRNLETGKTIHGFKGKSHSDETKNHFSEVRKEYLEKNPHIEWYTISNGTRDIKVQGLWELKVAEWLNRQGIKWDRKTISYGRRRYTPDFYLIEYDEYLEVKGWLRDRDLRKMFLVLDFHPGIRIRILEKPLYKKLAFLNLDEIPLFNEKYTIEDIDFDKFNDIWK